MTKTTKTVLSIGCTSAALFSLCALCLVAGAMHDDDPNAVVAQPTPSLNGRYACLTLSITGAGVNIQWVPSALPPFTITGSSYESANGSGSVTNTTGVIDFNGGPYDGWRGTVGGDSVKPFILFNSADHHTVRTDGARRGDFECFLQRD